MFSRYTFATAIKGLGSIRRISSKSSKYLVEENKKISDISRRAPIDSHDKISKKYISFNDFPKAPDSVLNQTTDELFANIYLNSKQGAVRKNEKVLIDFEIPDRYLKSQANDVITAKDKAVVEELDRLSRDDEDNESSQVHLNMIKLYYDQESDSYKPEREHVLKKTLSGMIKMNTPLDNIDDSYLWKLFPKNKLFGVMPFEQSIEKNGFKNWEQEEIKKKEFELKENEEQNKEFEDFKLTWKKAKSFYKVHRNGRRRLDRNLLKRFKKLQEEGKIDKDFNLFSFEDNDS